jgi:hypothetical protein
VPVLIEIGSSSKLPQRILSWECIPVSRTHFAKAIGRISIFMISLVACLGSVLLLAFPVSNPSRETNLRKAAESGE